MESGLPENDSRPLPPVPPNHRRDDLVWREDAHVLSIPGMR